MKAIIIIDMQYDFSDFGSLPIEGAIELAKNASKLINRINRDEYKIICVRDWHPFNHISFKTFPIHCIKHSEGAKLIEPLNEFKYDLYVKKGTKKRIDNFSCVYNGKKLNKLKKYLNDLNINDVLLIGVASEICIKESAIDLMKYDFNTWVIEDLILPIDKKYVLKLDGLNMIKSKDM